MRQPVVLSWSGGKDSAMALYEIQKSAQYDIAALLTTITEDYDRISMHGVRRELLEAQAESIGVPLYKVFIPKGCVNSEYEARMKEACMHFQAAGVHSVAFGDLFLQDIRSYREERLSRIGMKPVFPIWLRDTRTMLDDFVRLGFKAILVCVNPKQLDPAFAGRVIDESFVRDLPSGVDPCGENGEFHSFVYEGPIFKHPIPITKGDVILRDSFYFCDLLKEDEEMMRK